MNLELYKSIYKNTLQKEFRNKTLIFFFLFTVAVILLVSFLLSALKDSIGADMKVEVFGETQLLPIFFIVISSWNVMLGIFFGINCVKSDINLGVIQQILSFPIDRKAYLLIRVLGSWTIVMLYYTISMALAFVLFSTSLGEVAQVGSILAAMLFSFLQVLPAIVIGIIFSLYFERIGAFLLSFFTFAFINASNSYISFKGLDEILSDLSFIKICALVYYYAFPRMSNIGNYANASIMGTGGAWDKLPYELLHYSLSLSFLFIVMSMMFKKKSF